MPTTPTPTKKWTGRCPNCKARVSARPEDCFEIINDRVAGPLGHVVCKSKPQWLNGRVCGYGVLVGATRIKAS